VDGDLRLQGGGAYVFGNLSIQGRVEICLNNAWGTICDRQFGQEELRTVCTQIAGVTYQCRWLATRLCSTQVTLGLPSNFTQIP